MGARAGTGAGTGAETGPDAGVGAGAGTGAKNGAKTGVRVADGEIGPENGGCTDGDGSVGEGCTETGFKVAVGVKPGAGTTIGGEGDASGEEVGGETGSDMGTGVGVPLEVTLGESVGKRGVDTGKKADGASMEMGMSLEGGEGGIVPGTTGWWGARIGMDMDNDMDMDMDKPKPER